MITLYFLEERLVMLLGPWSHTGLYWQLYGMGKKVPNIPSLLVNNELINEFEAKANTFNKYFTSQCTAINNSSLLPSPLDHLADDNLSFFNISSEVIFQLIKNLDILLMDMMKFL